MKKILKTVKSNIFYFLFLSLIIMGLNLTPMILQYRHSPPGRTFSLVHNNIQDFYFYQSLMNEGANGAWLTSDPYTQEPHRPSIIFAYFTWIGKISKILGIPYAVMYHLLRIIFGFLLLSFIFYLLYLIKVPYPRLTFLLFLFASPLLHLGPVGNEIKMIPYMNWWTGMDPIRRVSYLPHHMMGGTLLVITLITIINFINKPKKITFVLLTILAVLMGFVHTPSLFIILIFLPPTLIISFVKKCHCDPVNLSANLLEKQSHEQTKKPVVLFNFIPLVRGLLRPRRLTGPRNDIAYTGLSLYWLIGVFILLTMVSQTNKGFPWNQYIAWEKNLQFPLDKELFGALGILVPFALLGTLKAFLSKKFEYILTACWLFTPFLFIPFAKALNISNIRLIQGLPYLPLAILSVLGITTIIQVIKGLLRPKARYEIIIRYCVIGIFLLIFAFFTIPTLKWSLNDQIREYWSIYGNVYLDSRIFNAFRFINMNFPSKAHTLSTFYTGNYLTAYTDTISYLGHFGYTYNVDEKEKSADSFFNGNMKENEAKQLIMSNKIDLVFQGYEEKSLFDKYLYPSILKPVYDQDGVTIYTRNF